MVLALVSSNCKAQIEDTGLTLTTPHIVSR